jgi:hypothetical protein
LSFAGRPAAGSVTAFKISTGYLHMIRSAASLNIVGSATSETL